MTFIERDVPEPREGEVLLEVQAASVNPFDWKFREGMAGPKKMSPPLPLGMDAAGVVVSVGAGVTHLSEGERVVAHLGLGPRAGAFTDHTIVKAQNVVALPENVSVEDAATLPTAAVTAFDMLAHTGAQEGDTVAVLGAGGAVGQFALQIARARGIRALGVARSGHREMIEQLGGTFVDSEQDPTGAVREAAPGGLAGVVDLVGGALLKDFGPLARAGKSVITAVDPKTAEGFAGQAREASHDGLRRVVELLANGSVVPPIEHTYPLAEVAEAYAHLEQRHPRGKILVQI